MADYIGLALMDKPINHYRKINLQKIRAVFCLPMILMGIMNILDNFPLQDIKP